MYKVIIPEELLSNLWRLREYACCGSIASQIRHAISEYILGEEQKIGCSIQEIQEIRDKHEEEKKNSIS